VPSSKKEAVCTKCLGFYFLFEGYCDDCTAAQTLITLKEFRTLCGRTIGAKPNQESSYDPLTVPITKAVHIIRNPFDNLVARMHRGVRKRKMRYNWTADQLSVFTDTSRGFLVEWCEKEVDDNFLRDTTGIYDAALASRIGHLASKVPCFGDWIRYVQWHNHAADLLRNLNVPVRIIHYEEYYGDTAGKTSHELLKFLGQPAADDTVHPLPFKASGKSYQFLYTEEQARAAAQLVRALASPRVWPLLRPYLSEWIEYDYIVAESNPRIIWQISFPNSGSSYTLENVMSMTNLSTASNYGHEALRSAGKAVPVLPSKRQPGSQGQQSRIGGGPFWLYPHSLHPKFVLTKTHCSGKCD